MVEDNANAIEDSLQRFKLAGDIWPLSRLSKAEGIAPAWRPSRPMGGWVSTYGKIGPDGGIVPTVDRDGQVVEAARDIGHMDWQPYIKGGVWNDTHDHDTIVGLPTTLEFHDGQTALSKAHGKIGFWTTGHLFDRGDAKSWAGLTDKDGRPRAPTDHELARADYFWALADLLKGLPRPLGLSADGVMALSPCRKRVLWARVEAAAVCETPVNPDATLEPMLLAVMAKSRQKCGNCKCDKVCARQVAAMAKAMGPGPVAGGQIDHPTVVPQYADSGDVQKALGSPDALRDPLADSELYNRVLELLQEGYFITRSQAERWLRDYLRRISKPSQSSKETPDGRRSEKA